MCQRCFWCSLPDRGERVSRIDEPSAVQDPIEWDERSRSENGVRQEHNTKKTECSALETMTGMPRFEGVITAA
jgi:hypothetical protein